MKHVELFAGIGGFRRAMDLISKDMGVEIKTIAFSEIDNKATLTYKSNFDTNNEIEMGDIVAFVKNKRAMSCVPQYDILSGGFPCQTFSMMGSQEGFGEERGQMFFRIMDMVYSKQPRYILLENVKNIITHDKGRTIAVIKSELEKAGYLVHVDIFNSADFGLPQKRNRAIIFARKSSMGSFDFSEKLVKNTFAKIDRSKCSLNFFENTINVLEKQVDQKYYLSERIKPTILSDGSAGFKSRSDIDQIIARPLTASMHKMHRACQDNYFSDLYINSNGQDRPSERMTKEELANLPIRKLMPKEAFLLQGFPHDFADKAKLKGVADGAMYKQAGNAVSVNTIYAVLYHLIKNEIIKD